MLRTPYVRVRNSMIIKAFEKRDLGFFKAPISREQFEPLQAVFEQSKQKTKPRVVDLYDVLCAILYVLKSGCQWRMLPRDFPNWPVVYILI